MDDSVSGVGAASLEDRHVVGLEMLDRPLETLLGAERRLGVARPDPLGRRTAVGRQEACFDAVPMELPARIATDALQPHVHEIGPGDAGERRDEIVDVAEEDGAHLSLGQATVAQRRFHRPYKVLGSNKKAYVRQKRGIESLQPGL
ncbi:MAG: hypothetical protein MI785_06290 [Kiloniellales bacterium]|nr:hypothetical protein [Kiloniellales bacterium]